MKLILVIVLMLIAGLCIGATMYLDTEGIGVRVYPQVVSAAPAEPFDCLVGQRGKEVYVDDNNDGAEAYLCFCGTINDDTNYEWLKVEDPDVLVVCFP